jgi:hypothetical protein
MSGPNQNIENNPMQSKHRGRKNASGDATTFGTSGKSTREFHDRAT